MFYRSLYLSFMEVKLMRISFTCFVFLTSIKIAAQNNSEHIDPSKPTNLYNRLSNSLEYNFLKEGKKTYGYRANIVWASPSQRHSAQLEVPLLYATSSQKFGLSDL
ncbi:MAG: hypothetical protein ACHQF0_11690, partial [Chitinophagales bacterium]